MGTPGPYWFLVRRTPDLGQLHAQLRRAKQCSTVSLSRRIDECLYGIETIRTERQLSRNNSYFESIIAEIGQADYRETGFLKPKSEIMTISVDCQRIILMI